MSVKLQNANNEKRILALYLGNNERENEKAKALIGQIEELYEVETLETAGNPFFEKYWIRPLPCTIIEPDPTEGGGGSFGLKSIESFVRYEKANRG